MLNDLNKLLPAFFNRKTAHCLSILIYHQVLPSRDYLRPGEPTGDEFNWQMALIRKYFTPLSLAEALQKLQDDTLPRNAVCVTFDDGYANNLNVSLPILQKWNIPATVFVATGFLNGGRMWNDSIIESVRTTTDHSWDMERLGLGVLPLKTENERKNAATQLITAVKHLPFEVRVSETENILKQAGENKSDLMLTDDQVRHLKNAGVEIGAHTVHHPILTRISLQDAHREIQDGRSYLENLLNSEIPFFAYPNGRLENDYDDSHVELVKSLGFTAAVTTNQGVSRKGQDIYQLNRFTPWDKKPLRFYARMKMNMA